MFECLCLYSAAASGTYRNRFSPWIKQSTGAGIALLDFGPTLQNPGRNSVLMPALLQMNTPSSKLQLPYEARHLSSAKMTEFCVTLLKKSLMCTKVFKTCSSN